MKFPVSHHRLLYFLRSTCIEKTPLFEGFFFIYITILATYPQTNHFNH